MLTGLHVRVIGGGIIGMSIARQLAKEGARVTVFDAGRIGNEASWAGAGMLAPGGELDAPGSLTDLALRSLRLYPDFVSELGAESEMPIDFRRCGAFSLAYTAAEAEELLALAARQNALGIYSEQFDPRRVPGVRTGALAAQYYPDDAVVNPRDVLRALRSVCRQARVALRECEPVHQIAEHSEYDYTVLSAGAWSNQVHLPDGRSMPRVFPVKGHLLSFDLTPSAEDAALCDCILRHNHTYLLRRAGDVMIAGATTENCGFERNLDGQVAAELAQRAVTLMPALSHRSYAAYTGFRPGTPDGQPVIERLGESSTWLAYGHYRNGILLAPVTAQLVARAISQASSEKDSPLPAAPRQ